MCTSFVSGRLRNRKLFTRVKREKLQRRIHNGKYIGFGNGIVPPGYHKSMECPRGRQKAQAGRSICALPPAPSNAAGTIDLPSCSRNPTLYCCVYFCTSRTVNSVTVKQTCKGDCFSTVTRYC